MSRLSTLSLPALVLGSMLVLAGCESSEERAARHFASALSLIEAGDEARALIELRNVFRFDGTHEQARRTYAELLLAQGDVVEATRNYLRLIEQYPNLVDVRQYLAEYAIGINDWDEVRRHGTIALELAPQDPRSQAIGLAMQYRDAVNDRSDAARADVFAKARQMLATQPENIILYRIVIDQLVTGADAQAARPYIETALTLDPGDLRLHTMMLRLIQQSGPEQAVTAQLEAMIARFPENASLQQDLLRWHVGRGDLDAAEAFVRAQAGAVDGPTPGHLAVVEVLRQIRGREAARAELERLIAGNADTPQGDTYRAFRAVMDFEDGRQSEAIATMEALLEGAEPSGQTRDLQANLARMYNATGQQPRARALVDTILSQDSTHVDALLARAGWAIQDGRIRAAIVDLRAAQSQAPRNPRVMNMLALAFERDGNIELATEQLAMALDASGRAAPEAIRYIRFLRDQGRNAAAERVLADARVANPGNVELVVMQAEMLLENGRWSEAGAIATALRETGEDTLVQIAQQIQASVLLGQNRVDEGLSLLEAMADPREGDIRSVATVISAQLRAGRPEAARGYLEGLIAENPQALPLLLLRANMEAVLGNVAAAEADFRAVLAAEPAADNAARLLFGLLRGDGRLTEARAVLQAGLAAAPDSLAMLWLMAQDLEVSGEYDEAIAIYERIYALEPDNIVTANNLASMLTTYREDPASLERAQTLVERLRGSDIPAFQDTYGWIAYRRGDLETAVDYLERASNGLPLDPLVQFHLGMVYADLNRPAEARAQLERALELGEGRNLPQLERARARLQDLVVPQN